MNRLLPKLFRVAFAVLAVVAALAAFCTLAAILLDPELPPDARIGPVKGVFLGQQASLALEPAADGAGEHALSLAAFDGNVTATIDRASGAVELFKSYGLPVLLIYCLFFAALFELLRRLFRNVGQGASFTPQSVRLVQIVGGALIVFAFVTAIAESWLAYALFGYLAEHTQLAVSGTPVQLPAADRPPLLGFESPFGSAEFLAGLLVLALAEVFRQGLALQRDSDLTV